MRDDTEPRSAPEPGTCGEMRPGWPDYPERHGLTAEHVPVLIGLATADTAGLDESLSWTPVHARRALAHSGVGG
jgi:hypothetical protein